MKPVSLKEEISHAKEVIEMYRNSWFVPVNGNNWDGKLCFAGEPAQWRKYLIAHATLRRLRSMKHFR